MSFGGDAILLLLLLLRRGLSGCGLCVATAGREGTTNTHSIHPSTHVNEEEKQRQKHNDKA